MLPEKYLTTTFWDEYFRTLGYDVSDNTPDGWGVYKWRDYRLEILFQTFWIWITIKRSNVTVKHMVDDSAGISELLFVLKVLVCPDQLPLCIGINWVALIVEDSLKDKSNDV